MPKVFASWVKMCASSALRSSDLVGMQPTLLQTPPQYFSSMMAVLQAQLRGADRGDVAARSGAEHDDVEVCGHGANFRGARASADRAMADAPRRASGPTRARFRRKSHI